MPFWRRRLWKVTGENLPSAPWNAGSVRMISAIARVGQRQLQLARVAVDRRRADQAGERALLDAEQLGLLGRQAAADQRREIDAHLLLVGLAVLVDRNLGVADARQRARPTCGRSRRCPRRRRR